MGSKGCFKCYDKVLLICPSNVYSSKKSIKIDGSFFGVASTWQYKICILLYVMKYKQKQLARINDSNIGGNIDKIIQSSKKARYSLDNALVNEISKYAYKKCIHQLSSRERTRCILLLAYTVLAIILDINELDNYWL